MQEFFSYEAQKLYYKIILICIKLSEICYNKMYELIGKIMQSSKKTIIVLVSTVEILLLIISAKDLLIR